MDAKDARLIAEKVAMIGRDVAVCGDPTVVSKKAGGHNLTTQQDIDSNGAIIEFLSQTTLGIPILSEETKQDIADPFALPELWCIDPIDGSTNRAKGIDYWSVSVTFLKYGKVVAAAVATPMGLPDGRVYSAHLNGGAFVDGDKPIFVGSGASLKGAFVTWDNSYNPEETTMVIGCMSKLSPAPWYKNFGSAVLTTAEVAAGIWDAHFHWAFKPWDIAAALILIPEAGGVVTDLKTLGPANIQTERAICGNPEMVRIILEQTGYKA